MQVSARLHAGEHLFLERLDGWRIHREIPVIAGHIPQPPGRCKRGGPLYSTGVTPGLDPGVHRSAKSCHCRIKSGNGAVATAGPAESSPMSGTESASPAPFDPAAAGWEPYRDEGFIGLVGPFWTKVSGDTHHYAFKAEDKHHNRRGVVQGG